MATEFPCTQCGAKLTYLPGSTVIKCGHCGHENPIQEKLEEIKEIDYEATLRSKGEQEETEVTRTVKCTSCAAEFTFEPNVHADRCPFCGTAIVTSPAENRHIKPAALLPFALAEREARDRLRQWLRKLWFAPNDITKQARLDDGLTGMYVPYWTYDAQTESAYSGERGIRYQVPETVQRTVDGRTVTETRYRTEIRWTPVRGRVARFFDDVLVVASHSLPKKYADRLRQWRLEALTPYTPEYLGGFRSEVYQVTLEEGFREAKGRMDDQIRSDVRRDIGGDLQRIHRVDTDYRDITFKHILLPVYLAAYRYGGKPYQFLVNGQTGEVQGARPWSWIKISIAAAAAVAVAGALIYFFA